MSSSDSDIKALEPYPRLLQRLPALIEEYAELTILHPKHFGVWNNYGSLLIRAGRIQQAIEALRVAASLKPHSPFAQSNFLLSLNYDENLDARSFADAHRRFANLFPQPEVSFSNDRNPDRVLRVGLLSSAFRSNAITFFFPGMLYPQPGIEVYCYSATRFPDEVTARFAAEHLRWRDISQCSDEEADAIIRKDEIDILVERGGHAGDNRLPLLARKPAPITGTGCDYLATVGVPGLGFRITDAIIDPPGSEELYPEQLLRLPETAYCYSAPAYAPETNPLPALTNGFVTFACFHRLEKVSDATLRLWAEVLHRVPESRILLHHVYEGQPSVSSEFKLPIEQRLLALGITADRLIWKGALALDESIRLYQQTDVALDCWPYAGVTTTCQALYMGVPVVTMTGERPMSRYGASVLAAAGLEGWIVKKPEEYVDLVTKLASDLPALAQLRNELRPMIQRSTLTDESAYASRLAMAYRDIWREWCYSSAAD